MECSTALQGHQSTDEQESLLDQVSYCLIEIIHFCYVVIVQKNTEHYEKIIIIICFIDCVFYACFNIWREHQFYEVTFENSFGSLVSTRQSFIKSFLSRILHCVYNSIFLMLNLKKVIAQESFSIQEWYIYSIYLLSISIFSVSLEETKGFYLTFTKRWCLIFPLRWRIFKKNATKKGLVMKTALLHRDRFKCQVLSVECLKHLQFVHKINRGNLILSWKYI